MLVYKRKGNILIAASLYLTLAMIFFLAIYEVLEDNIYKSEIINVYKSGLEFEGTRYALVDGIQDKINELEKFEENKYYSYKNYEIEKKYSIKEIEFKIDKEKVDIRFKHDAINKFEKFSVYKSIEKVCSCGEEECIFNKEKIILIPKMEVK